MAATGEEAAAMDSICKAPAPPTDLNLSAEPVSEPETEPEPKIDAATSDATETPKAKRPSNNSELHL